MYIIFASLRQINDESEPTFSFCMSALADSETGSFVHFHLFSPLSSADAQRLSKVTKTILSSFFRERCLVEYLAKCPG
jgi:hypothetical protein